MLDHEAANLFRLLVLAPVLEEFIVRAGLQEWLLRRPGPPGAALTLGLPALVFAALHLGAGWAAAAAVLPAGLAFGLVYRRWRDWRLCALAHALCNGVALGFCSLSI